MADSSAVLDLLSGAPNATAVADYSPPSVLKGLLPIKQSQPIWVVEPFGMWWFCVDGDNNSGYIRHSFLAPHWTEPQAWFAISFFVHLADLLLPSTRAPNGFRRQLYALEDCPADFSIPSTITVSRGDLVLVADEEIIDSERMWIAQNVRGLKGHVQYYSLGTLAELFERYPSQSFPSPLLCDRCHDVRRHGTCGAEHMARW